MTIRNPASDQSASVPSGAALESAAQFVETREGRLAYVEAAPTGDASCASEPALVLIHGFTGHRDDFLPVLEALAKSRRVLVPDLRGHGNSVKQAGASGWNFQQFVRDLEAFVDALGLSKFDLLGHSMGGFVALRFALTHPDRLRSLTLVCTGPETPAALPRDGFEKAAAIAAGRGMDGLQAILEKVGRVEASPTLAAWGERYWLHHRRRFGAMSPESYAEIGRAFFASASLVHRLSEIDLPTLCLVGEFDHDWLSGAEHFAERLPNVRRTILKNAEHHPHQENTADFLRELNAHLASVSARPT